MTSDVIVKPEFLMHLFVMLRLVYTKLRKLKKLPNGGSLVSFIITTLNLNVSLRLYLKLNLKLNLNLSLNLNLNLKLNVSLKFNLKLIFFWLCFPSRTFTIHRTVWKEENYFFHIFLLLPSSS